MNLKKFFFSFFSILSIIGYGYFVSAAAPSGGYNPGQILDPDCAPGDVDCIVTLPSGSSGWGLIGNSGTTAGTNFIGTTDAQDFVVKTNGNQVAKFGINGGVAFGDSALANGQNSFAYNRGIANGDSSWAIGKDALAEEGGFAFSTGDHANALGNESWAMGHGVDAIGDFSKAFGVGVTASSYAETVFGVYSKTYTPQSIDSFNNADQLFVIGNGIDSTILNSHNAYTLWKDGSFAYNDDNFQNDNLGTEQNTFYFNYGNHDGLGGAQQKQAIRLGSSNGNEWDINSANVGEKSIAIGFAFPTYNVPGPVASGFGSISFGAGSIASNINATAFNLGTASGVNSIAFGGIASGDYSFTFGYKGNIPPYSNTEAIGVSSYAFGSGSHSIGNESFTLGSYVEAYSFGEIVLGRRNTSYTPNSLNNWNQSDRLLTVGNSVGTGFESDAFTILKNGETGIGIDNFEANTNGNIFQVGDGTTNIIGYVDDTTGNWVNVSDERKKNNIQDLSYGLHEILQLRPTSFDYKRNGEHAIGFIAQEVLPIIPESVYGSESDGYGMSYATLTPVIVKAIQEMNLNITELTNMERPNTWRDSLIAWFGNVENGITEFIAGTIRAKTQICIDDVCMTKDQLRQVLEQNNIQNTVDLSGDIVQPDENSDTQLTPTDTPVDTSTDVPVDDSTTPTENNTDNTENTEAAPAIPASSEQPLV